MVSSNRRTLLKRLGTSVLALFLVTAMWVPVFADHPLVVDIQMAEQTTVDGGTVLSLLATSSADVDTYEWSADPDVGTFSDPAAEDTTWTAPPTATDDRMVVLTLDVATSDGDHVAGTDMVMITVRGADPTVSIQTEDQTVFGGDSIDLQATSADLNTRVNLYAWTMDSAIDSDPFRDLDAEDTIWTAPPTTMRTQVFTLTLTVTDNNGTDDLMTDDITARDSVTITVRRGPVDPTAVSIQTPDPAEVAGGTVVELKATSRSADVPGATRLWTATPNVGTFSDPAAEDTIWTAPDATADDQVVTLILTVTDSDGGGARARVTITVLSGPTVSIQTKDQTVFGGDSIDLQATYDDYGKGITLGWTATVMVPDGDPVAVGRFSPSPAVPEPTWTAPATRMDDQVVTLTLTASDDDDDSNNVSDSVKITVPGADPTVSIETADRTVVLGGASIALAAMSVDSGGMVANLLWTATAGMFSDPAVEDATWTAPGTTAATQVVTLTLTVTDNDGATASDSVTITVPRGPTVSIQTRDQTVDGGTDVELDATSLRRSARNITRRWTATNDAGMFSNAERDDTTWTAPPTTPATQVVTLTLTVTDNNGTVEETDDAKAIASVTITVPGTNPTVSIQTEDQIVLGGASIALEATSADPNGTIVSYLWTVTDPDGDPVEEAEAGAFSPSATEEDPTWTAPPTTADDQVVTLTLTVTANGGAAGDDSVTITVPSGPAEVSIETKDQTVPGGTVVNLLAESRSADVPGVTRLWTATPNVGTFSNAAVEDAIWTAPVATAATQVVTLTLTVTDSDGATGSASVTITVPGTDPTVSIQTPDPDVVAGGTVVELEATSRSANVPGATHLWTATPNVGTFSNAAVEDAIWTAPGTTSATQVVTLTLTVTDSDGATGSASVTITVLSGPTVSIETVDQTVFGGDSIDLQAEAEDSDGGTVESYLWTVTDPDGDPVEEAEAGVFSPSATEEDPTWTAPEAMAATQVVTLTLTVTASEDDIVIGSDSVTITVPGTTPTVSIETMDQTVPGGTVLQLQATSADPNGTIAMYAWATVLAIVPDPFSDAAVEDPTWTAPATTPDDQVFTLTLTVTDNNGNTANESVTITVSGTDPTVSIQTEDQTVLGGDSIELVAMSSEDDSSAWTADPAVGTFSDAAVEDEDATWTAPVATAATQVVTLTLTVTDNNGTADDTDDDITASDSVTITVPGTDPTVSIETMDQTVPGGTVLQLQATSADPNGTIAMYAWATDPVTTGTFSDAAVEDATWTAPATTAVNQVVTLTLTVTDNNGNTANESVTITVPGTDPTVSIQTEDQDVAGGTVLSLSATSSEDDVTEHAWTATPAVGTFSNAAVEDATWTAPAATTDDQVVTLTLTVTDSDGATASASVTITVSDSVMITVPGVSGGPVLASVRVDDGPSHDGTGNDSRGNNDGIAQCAETIELYVSIRNDGELPLTGLSGELIETDPLVRLLYNASSSYPDVAAGSIQENRLDWDLRVSPDAPSGHEFSFTIRLTADQGGPWDVLVTVPIGCASPGDPVLASVRVDDGPSHDGTGNDSRGNNDDIAQCGETIELYVSIRNDGELPLTGLSGELIETDPLVRLLYNASSSYPDVAAGSIQENRLDWDLRVSPDAPSGHEFSFTIRLTADQGGPWDVLVTVPIACG